MTRCLFTRNVTFRLFLCSNAYSCYCVSTACFFSYIAWVWVCSRENIWVQSEIHEGLNSLGPFRAKMCCICCFFLTKMVFAHVTTCNFHVAKHGIESELLYSNYISLPPKDKLKRLRFVHFTMNWVLHAYYNVMIFFPTPIWVIDNKKDKKHAQLITLSTNIVLRWIQIILLT